MTYTSPGTSGSLAFRPVANANGTATINVTVNARDSPGWSTSIGGRMRVEQSLLAESWNPHYAALGFDPSAEDPAFLKPAVSELAKSDGAA